MVYTVQAHDKISRSRLKIAACMYFGACLPLGMTKRAYHNENVDILYPRVHEGQKVKLCHLRISHKGSCSQGLF